MGAREPDAVSPPALALALQHFGRSSSRIVRCRLPLLISSGAVGLLDELRRILRAKQRRQIRAKTTKAERMTDVDDLPSGGIGAWRVDFRSRRSVVAIIGSSCDSKREHP